MPSTSASCSVSLRSAPPPPPQPPGTSSSVNGVKMRARAPECNMGGSTPHVCFCVRVLQHNARARVIVVVVDVVTVVGRAVGRWR